LAILAATMIMMMAVRDFILPVMYQYKLSVSGSWGLLKSSKRLSWGKILKYFIIVFFLGFLATLIQTVAGLFSAVGVVVAGGAIIIPGILLTKTIPLLTVPLIVVGVAITVLLVVTGMILTGVVMLPVTIFFRTFALAYLTRIFPECDLLEFLPGGSAQA